MRGVHYTLLLDSSFDRRLLILGAGRPDSSIRPSLLLLACVSFNHIHCTMVILLYHRNDQSRFTCIQAIDQMHMRLLMIKATSLDVVRCVRSRDQVAYRHRRT